MKKVLITGLNSYIGTSFKELVSLHSNKYLVETISLRDYLWKNHSFESYDVVLHTAAIVHAKEDEIDQYYRVNRDLTIEVAKKAKKEGVGQFIFLSTMGVYGKETGYISRNTIPLPQTPYAKSKHEAEFLLQELENSSFNIAILRPPIVYGKNCPGNYKKLSKISLKLPVFPKVSNKRSMIYIDNLSEFIRLLIDFEGGGIYFPQNREYVNTSELVRMIAKAKGKNLVTTNSLNLILKVGLNYSSNLRKVFGSFVYDKDMLGSPRTLLGDKNLDYEIVSFEKSVLETER